MRYKILGLIFLLAPFACGGEELFGLQKSQDLTLARVIQKTFEHSPQKQTLTAGKTLVEARAAVAEGLLPGAPAVSVRHQNDLIGSGRNLREWEAALELPVWLPGQRAARESVAHQAGASLDASQGYLMLDLAGQVRETVWDVTLNQNNLALAEQRLVTAQQLQLDVEKRWKAGELAKTDVMLAQNEALQAQTALLRAQADLKHAEHRYWMLTGLKEIPAIAEESQSTRSEINDNHPILADAIKRVDLARDERTLANVEKRENPQLIVSARHERGAFDNAFDSSVGMAIRIPLDAKVRSAPVLANAEMGLAQASSERDRRMLNLQTILHEADHNLEVTRSELKIVEQQNRLAQENLRLAKKAFDLGESDLVSLMRVQAMAQEAERALRNRQIQLQLDIARYNQAVGVLP